MRTAWAVWGAAVAAAAELAPDLANIAEVPPRCTAEHLAKVKGWLFDIDGTLTDYNGKLRGFDQLFEWLDEGHNYVLLSNGFKNREAVSRKLRRPEFKVSVPPDRVLTAGVALGEYLERHLSPGAWVLFFGTVYDYGDGTPVNSLACLKPVVSADLYDTWDIRTDLTMQETYEWASAAKSGAKQVAIVQGFDDGAPDVDDVYLSKMAILLRNGAYYIVAGVDSMFMMPHNAAFPELEIVSPWTGCYEDFLLSASEMFPGTAREQQYHINVGKGGNAGVECMMKPVYQQLKQFDSADALNSHSDVMMVGDTLGTDVQAAVQAGMQSMLVLTGSNKLADVADWHVYPTCWLESIAEIPALARQGAANSNAALKDVSAHQLVTA